MKNQWENFKYELDLVWMANKVTVMVSVIIGIVLGTALGTFVGDYIKETLGL